MSFHFRMKFENISEMKYVFFYAGNIPGLSYKYWKKGLIGLSYTHENFRHIRHDITKPYPIPDCCVDAYQSEDVFEHIEYDSLVNVINEIYRILKKGGYFRLSIPDYRCDILNSRTVKDDNGEIVFDPFAGGKFVDNKVVDGGHVWFPTYEKVKSLIDSSMFTDYKFYHYYNEQGESVTNKIDYSKGYIQRTPDNDKRVRDPYRALSIVVDMYK